MKKGAKSVAVGGIFTALTAVVCMLGSMSVAGRFIGAAISGITLLLVQRYVSGKLAAMIYAVSAVLLFFLPDRLTAAAYALLLGYYPILTAQLQKLPLAVQVVVKLVLLTAVGCLCMFGGAALLGLWDNPILVKYRFVLILVYYVMAVIYDLFLLLLRGWIWVHWDEKLKKLFR